MGDFKCAVKDKRKIGQNSIVTKFNTISFYTFTPVPFYTRESFGVFQFFFITGKCSYNIT